MIHLVYSNHSVISQPPISNDSKIEENSRWYSDYNRWAYLACTLVIHMSKYCPDLFVQYHEYLICLRVALD